MRKMMMALFLVAGATVVQAQNNFYTTVTNLWYQGHKSNVLAMAEARLQQNTNDIAGLIIKVEYDIDFAQRHTISNSIQRALDVGQTVMTTNFVQFFQNYEDYVQDVLDAVKENPLAGAALQAEQAKGNFKHFPFSAKEELEALLKDGYFDQ
jgi:hypothetical protein